MFEDIDGSALTLHLNTLVQRNVIIYANVTLPLALVPKKLNKCLPFSSHVIPMK